MSQFHNVFLKKFLGKLLKQWQGKFHLEFLKEYLKKYLYKYSKDRNFCKNHSKRYFSNLLLTTKSIHFTLIGVNLTLRQNGWSPVLSKHYQYIGGIRFSEGSARHYNADVLLDNAF